MASWKLKVEDYGKIKSAEIEIAPLTLFVGDNNSGKSYLLSLLWGIDKFGIEALVGENHVHTEEANALSEWFCNQIDIAVENNDRYETSLEPISELLNSFLNHELEKNKNNLVKKIFNSENVDIGKLEIQLNGIEKMMLGFELKKIKSGYICNIDMGRQYGFVLDASDIMDKRYRRLDFIHWYWILRLYSVILGIDTAEREADENIYLPAARTGFMLTKDIINKVGRKNTFNLVEEKENITPFIRPINQFLDVMNDLSVEDSGYNMELVWHLEHEITNGTVDISAMPNKEVQYIPKGTDKAIPLRLSSAVVTELSPLILILKHKEDVNRLYYEEPEMCLHPQLQSKMGKMLGEIVNSGIGMVVTTHSDIILQHINNMIKLSKREDKERICKEFGYTSLDLLSDRQVKVYQLMAKAGEKTEVEELICGENGFCIPTFNDALDIIMNEAYEIQG